MSLRRMHSWLGALLGAYACFHLFRQWPALESREAWFERGQHYGLGPLLGSLVVLGFIVYAFLGLRLWRARRATGDAPGVFPLVTGSLVLGFLVFHLLQVRLGPSGPHENALAAYQRLWSGLGHIGPLLAYIAGVTALAFHMAMALLRGIPSDARALRAGVLVAAVLLWLGYLQVVARFAVGESLIPLGSSTLPTEGPSLEGDGPAPDH